MVKKTVEKISLLFNSKTKSPLSGCYAPFNNLLIDQQGCLKICCHNISYVLGRFPDDRIIDAWLGEKRQLITNQFLFGETPDSCINCIKSGLNIDLYKTKTVYSKRKDLIDFNQYPYQVDFGLDNKCNLDCIMCSPNISTRSTVEEKLLLKKVKFDDEFFYQIKPFLAKGKFFVFGGGEPFLIPIYYKMWNYITENNQNASIYVQTNGTLLTDEIKMVIEKNKLNIGISIDAISKVLYEQIRRNSSYEEVFKNLEYFITHSVRHNNIMSVMVTPMTVNAEEIPEMVEFCNNKNLNLSFSILDRPYHLALWTLPSERLYKLIDFYKKHKFSEYKKNSVFENNNNTFDNHIKLIEKYAFRKKFNELNKQKILSEIIRQSEKIETKLSEVFNSYLRDAVPEDKSNEIFNRVYSVLMDLFNNDRYLNENRYLFYSYFINKDIDMNSFVDNLYIVDNNTLSEIFKEKINDRKILVDTLSFDRIIDLNYNE